jgi:hypothetical protein
MSAKGADDLTLSDPLTEGEGDETCPPGEGGDDGDGVGGPGEGGPEQLVVEPKPVLMSTEAQTEGPAMRAGPPWAPWALPPPWVLPRPMAAGREPVGGPWYPPGPPQDPQAEDRLVERVVSRLVDILGPRLAAQTPPRFRQDLREAHQGLHAGAQEVEELSFPEELPLASSTGVRVEDRRPMKVTMICILIMARRL